MSLSQFSSATLLESSPEVKMLPGNIKALYSEMTISGPAFPVRVLPGNNYVLHQAIYHAPKGSVIVAYVDDGVEHGYWGEIMTHAALKRNMSGLVFNGCVRDSKQIIELGFPVFSAGLSIRGTAKEPSSLQVAFQSVSFGEAQVEMSDIILGDADGLVVVPQSTTSDVLDVARKREMKEKALINAIQNGQTTIDLLELGRCQH